MGSTTITGAHVVKFDEGSAKIINIENTSAVVTCNSVQGITVYGNHGKYIQQGNCTNIISSAVSQTYCMIFESGFTSAYLNGGLAVDPQNNLLPIQVRSQAVDVSIHGFIFDQAGSML